MSITNSNHMDNNETSVCWMSGIYTTEKYVRVRIQKTTRTLFKIHMQTLMRRKKSMEIAQIIDDALYEYYVVELVKTSQLEVHQRSRLVVRASRFSWYT